MTDTADKGLVHEFDFLDTDELHLVSMGANGFSPLLAKGAADAVGAVIDEAGELTKARWAGFCGEEGCEACKETFGVRYEPIMVKARLKTKERNKLPSSAFALPASRQYPIHDENHARAALSMLHNASPDDQSKIKAAVHRRYPDIGEGDDVKTGTKKEGAPQSSHEDGGVPSHEASLEQTRENHPHAGSVLTDSGAGSGAKDPTMSGHPAPSADQEGHGSTAPNKDLPIGESSSQTRMNTRKAGDGDGTGSKAPNGDADAAAARSEAGTQTDEVHRKGTPGDPEWERRDAELAEEAGRLIDELEDREKAEESGGAPGALKLSPATKETIRRAAEVSQRVLGANEASKEIDVTPEDLAKTVGTLLDERDAQKAADKKERAAKRAKKASKAKKAKGKMKGKKPSMTEEEMAEKMAADPVFAAEQQLKAAKAAQKIGAGGLAKSLETLVTAQAETQALVAKIAAQPQPTPLLSGAALDAAGIIAGRGGAVAAIRGGAGQPGLVKERQAGEPWSVDSVRQELMEKGVLGPDGMPTKVPALA